MEAVGPAADPALVGQRVIVDPDPKCGACASCRAGRPATCSHIVALGIFRDGALASHVLAPASACFPISDAVPAPVAALVEPLACVMNGTQKAAVRPGESVVVFGGGAIGCLFTAVLSASGARPVIVVEPRPERAPVAKALGATEVMTPAELAGRRAELLPEGADVVVDAVGSVLPGAIEVAAQSARIVVFGMDSTANAPVRQVEITEKGLTILGSYITDFTFPAAIRFVESGLVDLAPINRRRAAADRHRGWYRAASVGGRHQGRHHALRARVRRPKEVRTCPRPYPRSGWRAPRARSGSTRWWPTTPGCPGADEMLDWMLGIGYAGTELGPPGYLGRGAEARSGSVVVGLRWWARSCPSTSAAPIGRLRTASGCASR